MIGGPTFPGNKLTNATRRFGAQSRQLEETWRKSAQNNANRVQREKNAIKKKFNGVNPSNMTNAQLMESHGFGY